MCGAVAQVRHRVEFSQYGSSTLVRICGKLSEAVAISIGLSPRLSLTVTLKNQCTLTPIEQY
jgi:hypothetical protein